MQCHARYRPPVQPWRVVLTGRNQGYSKSLVTASMPLLLLIVSAGVAGLGLTKMPLIPCRAGCGVVHLLCSHACEDVDHDTAFMAAMHKAAALGASLTAPMEAEPCHTPFLRACLHGHVPAMKLLLAKTLNPGVTERLKVRTRWILDAHFLDRIQGGV